MSDERALLFKYAAEELEQRDLCKQALVIADDGRKASFYTFGVGDEKYFRARADDELNWIAYKSCSQIVACCVVGSLDLAVFCHADAFPDEVGPGRYSGIDQLVQVLVATRRDEVIEALNWRYGFPAWVSTCDFVDAHAVLKALQDNEIDESDIGEEGLLPLWNDHPSRTKDDVVELLRAAEAQAVVQT